MTTHTWQTFPGDSLKRGAETARYARALNEIKLVLYIEWIVTRNNRWRWSARWERYYNDIENYVNFRECVAALVLRQAFISFNFFFLYIINANSEMCIIFYLQFFIYIYVFRVIVFFFLIFLFFGFRIFRNGLEIGEREQTCRGRILNLRQWLSSEIDSLQFQAYVLMRTHNPRFVCRLHHTLRYRVGREFVLRDRNVAHRGSLKREKL